MVSVAHYTGTAFAESPADTDGRQIPRTRGLASLENVGAALS